MQSCNSVLRERSSRQRLFISFVLLTCINVVDMNRTVTVSGSFIAKTVIMPYFMYLYYILKEITHVNFTLYML